MKRRLCQLCLAAGVLIFVSGCKPPEKVVLPQTFQTVSLAAFTNFSAFDDIQAPWLLPKGQQVFDGVPFQVDGVIQLSGSGRPGNSGHPDAPDGVTNIIVNSGFEVLHLLMAVDGSTDEGADVAQIKLVYMDGSQSTLSLKYGDQIRNWTGPWHRSEKPLHDTNATSVAWIGQASDPASVDRYARLYHVMLKNPRPDKNVSTISLSKVVDNVGPFFAGITIAPASAEREENTVDLPASPYPDLRRRTGEPTAIKGVVKTLDGAPLAGAKVQAVSARKFNSRTIGDDLPDNITATTDAKGQFSLPPLPDNRLYALTVSMDGMQSQDYYGADPKSDPIEIRLQ
ncbi:MAG TPA: carboxypeptidase-like regulatory domain-containing protein [Verrucomicrobiae bacterium]|jgi:hypothetical protein